MGCEKLLIKISMSKYCFSMNWAVEKRLKKWVRRLCKWTLLSETDRRRVLGMVDTIERILREKYIHTQIFRKKKVVFCICRDPFGSLQWSSTQKTNTLTTCKESLVFIYSCKIKPPWEKTTLNGPVQSRTPQRQVTGHCLPVCACGRSLGWLVYMAPFHSSP